jgi:hypothetical protein
MIRYSHIKRIQCDLKRIILWKRRIIISLQ